LKQLDLWRDDEWTRIEADVTREIDQSVEFAEASRWEPVEELTRFVYSEAAPSSVLPRIAGED
jgi:pyruvate dehydrogenase E1 component alpha subunit